MSLKQILVTIFLAIIFGLAAAFFVYKQNFISKKTSPVVSISPTPTPIELLTWDDEAGFSFQYLKDISIDKHPEDTENYANLTLTEKDQTDSINILMKDNFNKSLDKWVVSDITIDGKEVKKITTSAETTIGIIDNDVLITIKRDNNLSPSLETTWQKIIDTWTFIYPTPTISKTKTATTTNDSEDLLEEE